MQGVKFESDVGLDLKGVENMMCYVKKAQSVRECLASCAGLPPPAYSTSKFTRMLIGPQGRLSHGGHGPRATMECSGAFCRHRQ